MSGPPQFEQVGRGFSGQYYNCIANSRDQLAGVYRDASLVTWCNAQLMGLNQIMPKLMGLAFNQSQWKAEEVDCQPMQNGAILVVTQGLVRIDGEQRPLRFNDVMILQQDQRGWFIANQVFRILGGTD